MKKTLMNERLPAPTERPTKTPRERTHERMRRILASDVWVEGAWTDTQAELVLRLQTWGEVAFGDDWTAEGGTLTLDQEGATMMSLDVVPDDGVTQVEVRFSARCGAGQVVRLRLLLTVPEGDWSDSAIQVSVEEA